MKILISGGGTGGHIYPALAILESLKENCEKRGLHLEVMYLGAKKGLENEFVPKNDLLFQVIDVQGLKRSFSFENILVVLKAVWAVLKSFKIILKFKPDAIIGTGGFVCGPVLLAGSFLRVPTFIQEQNAYPGITNKILSFFVKKIIIGSDSAKNHFSSFVQDKIIFTGNPVRKKFYFQDGEKVKKFYGLKKDDFVLLVTGGSRGAKSINRAMLSVHRYFANKENFKIIHITGRTDYLETLAYYQKEGFSKQDSYNVFIQDYLDNMPEVLKVANLVVSRSGAIALAEIALCALPAILIPYPFAAENHQYFNAKILEEKGAAVLLEDAEIKNENVLRDKIIFLWKNNEKLQKMSQRSEKQGNKEASNNIAELVLNNIKKF